MSDKYIWEIPEELKQPHDANVNTEKIAPPGQPVFYDGLTPRNDQWAESIYGETNQNLMKPIGTFETPEDYLRNYMAINYKEQPLASDFQSFWEDPIKLARYKIAIDNLPPGMEAPSWYNKAAVDKAWAYMSASNPGRYWEEWTPLDPAHPIRSELRELGTPPLEAIPDRDWGSLTPQEIWTTYSDGTNSGLTGAMSYLIQQGLGGSPLSSEAVNTALASYEPGQLDANITGVNGLDEQVYQSLPPWKKMLVWMGSSGAAGSAAQAGGIGAAMGLLTNGLGGLVAGGALGAGLGAGASATQNSMPWLANALNVLDLPAEGLERIAGMISQIGVAAVEDAGDMFIRTRINGEDRGKARSEVQAQEDSLTSILNDLPSAWKASAITYETAGVSLTGGKIDTLEQAESIQLDPDQFGASALKEARAMIQNGASLEDVRMEFANRYGVTGQMYDLAGHVLADPLNLIPAAGLKLGAKIAQKTGNEALQLAFKVSSTQKGWRESDGVIRTLTKTYPALLRLNMDDAAKIPGKFGAWSRHMAGIDLDMNGHPVDRWFTPEGQAEVRKKKLFAPTPEARAEESASNILMHVGLNINDAVTPTDVTKTLTRMANTDPNVAAQVGDGSWANSAEASAAPVLMRDVAKKLPELQENLWDIHEPDRALFNNLAKASGVDIEDSVALNKFMRELAKDPDNVLAQVKRALTEAGNNELLAVLNDPMNPLKGIDLKKRAEMFIDGRAVMTLDEYKARVTAYFLDGVEKELVKWFDIKPDKWIFRLGNTIKNTQSMLLLGMNPTYYMNNVINNVVTQAFSGVLGFDGRKANDAFWKRLGIDSPRRLSGVGAADVLIKQGASPIAEAKQAGGLLGKIDGFARKINKVLPFTNLSQKAEVGSSDIATTVAGKKAWYAIHKAGVGFDKMSKPAEQTLRNMGIEPQFIYAAAENGMNIKEIEANLWDEVSYNFLSQVATPDQQRLLQDVGVYDSLSTRLRKAKNGRDIDQAFKDTADDMRKYVKAKAAMDQVTETVKWYQKVITEGSQAAFKSFDDALLQYADFFSAYQKELDDFHAGLEKVPVGRRRMLKEQFFAKADENFKIQRAQRDATLLGVGQALMGNGSPQEIQLTDKLLVANDLHNDFFGSRKRIWQDFFNAYDGDWQAVTEFTDSMKNVIGEERVTELQTQYADKWMYRAAQEANRVNYRNMNEALDDVQLDIDNLFVEMFETHYPGGRNAAIAWRAQARYLQQVMVEAEDYFRHGEDGNKLGELGATGSNVKKLIDEILGGQVLNDIDQKDKYWKQYHQKVKQPLIQDQLKASQICEVNIMDAASGKKPIVEQKVAQPKAEKKPEKVFSVVEEKVEKAAVKKMEVDLKAKAQTDEVRQIVQKPDKYIVNIVNKYGEKVKSISEVTPDMARNAMEERARVKAEAEAKPAEQVIGEGITSAKQISRNPEDEFYSFTGEGIKGDNGNSLVAYQHIRTKGEKYSKYEEGLVSAKVSDMERAESCTNCGRKIVHVYWVKDQDGKIKPFGSEHLHQALGKEKPFTDTQTKKMVFELEAKAKAEQERFRVLLNRASENKFYANSAFNQANPGADLSKSYFMVSEDGKYVRVNNDSDARLLEEQGYKKYNSSGVAETEPEEPMAHPRTKAEIENELAYKAANLDAISKNAHGVYNREAFAQDMVDVFKLPQEQADGVMAVLDVMADYWSKRTGKAPERWWTESIAEVVEGGEGQINQAVDTKTSLARRMGIPDESELEAEIERQYADRIAYLDEWKKKNKSDVTYDLAEQRVKVEGWVKGFYQSAMNARDKALEIIEHFKSKYPDANIEPAGSMYRGDFWAKGSRSYDIDFHISNLPLPEPKGSTIRLTDDLKKLFKEFKKIDDRADVFVTANGKLWILSDGKLSHPREGRFGKNQYMTSRGVFTGNLMKMADFEKSFYADLNKAREETNNSLLFQTVNQNYFYNTVLSDAEVEGYALALSRTPNQIVNALGAEQPKERIRLLDALYKIDPNLARKTAMETKGTLWQRVKVTETDIDLIDRAKDYFGVDNNWKRDGWIHPDGTILKLLNGGHGQPDIQFGLEGYYAYGRKTNSIRWVYRPDWDEVSIDLHTSDITPEQLNVILNAVDKTNVSIEYSGGKTNTHGGKVIYLKNPTREELLEALFNSDNRLFQQAKGATSWIEDGRAIMHALENADVSTAIHESAHVWLRTLPGVADDDIATVTNWLRTEYKYELPDDWVTGDVNTFREAHEAFARAFEKYLQEGKAPKPELQKVFDSFKEWLTAIYRKVRGLDDVKLTDEMRALFDKWMGDEQPLPDGLDYMPKRPVGQMGMFRAGEDSPLVTGTAPRAEAEVFNPADVQRQDALFDVQPEMKGAIKGGDAVGGEGMLFQEVGKTWAFGTDPNKQYEFTYRVVNLDDLITSNKPDTLAKNPKYPAELQPRDRTRAASKAQIDAIARDLSPDALLEDVHSLDRGPMIVGADNVVESGNGRVLALYAARRDHPEKFTAYTEQLRQSLERYGLSEADVEGIENPVLVRERVTDVDRASFASEANETVIQRQSQYETALNDAKLIRPEALADLIIAEGENIETALRKVNNQDFVRAFIGALPENERSTIMAADGTLSIEGLQRIKRALFTAVYPGEVGERLTRVFTESIEEGTSNIQNVLYSTLAEMAMLEGATRTGKISAELALADDLSKVVDVYARLKQSKTTADDYLAQISMFGNELNEFQGSLLKYIYDNSRKTTNLRDLIRGYVQEAMKQPPAEQIDMFGDRVTKGEILDAVGKKLGQETEFAGETKPPTVEAVSEVVARPETTFQQPKATQAPIPPVQTVAGTVDSLAPPPQTSAMIEGMINEVNPVLNELHMKYLQADADTTRPRGKLADRMREGIKKANPGLSEVEIDNLLAQGTKEVQKYIRQVGQQMKGEKLATMKLGLAGRDYAILNYNQRTNFDTYMGAVFPYQFWYTRSMMNWAMRGLDRPAMLANYSRIRKTQSELGREGLPYRLRNKSFIPMPFMPDWMGEGVYFDPLKQAFPFEQFTKPIDNLLKQQNTQVKKAMSILHQWESEGEAESEAVTEALQTQSGDLWKRAMAQADIEMEQDIENPFDFVTSMMGTSLPIQYAYQLAMGRPERISQLPITRFVQAMTGMANIGGPAGINLEAPIRKAVGLPEMDRYYDYRVNRMLANMAAEGTITAEQASQAIVSKSGPVFEQAQGRVAQMGGWQYLGAPLGVDFFPEGEQIDRALQKEYNNAITKWKAGDEDALTTFFDKYPEYETQMLAWKDEGEQLKRFLISEVWDRYMDLPAVHKKQVQEQFGDNFTMAFLDSETRDYDALDTETITMWAQMLNGFVPEDKKQTTLPLKLADDVTAKAVDAYYADRKAKFGEEITEEVYQSDKYNKWRNAYLAKHPEILEWVTSEQSELYGLPAEVQQQVYQFRAMRDAYYPNIYETQNEYFDLDKEARKEYLKQHPELTSYWDFREQVAGQYPKAATYIMSDQAVSNALTDQTPYAVIQITRKMSGQLYRQFMGYLYGNETLTAGAKKELKRLWQEAGEPEGDLDEWLDQAKNSL